MESIFYSSLLFVGAPGGIRTPDLPVRSRTLYPTKLLVHTLYYYNLYKRVFQVKNKKTSKSCCKIVKNMILYISV